MRILSPNGVRAGTLRLGAGGASRIGAMAAAGAKTADAALVWEHTPRKSPRRLHLSWLRVTERPRAARLRPFLHLPAAVTGPPR